MQTSGLVRCAELRLSSLFIHCVLLALTYVTPLRNYFFLEINYVSVKRKQVTDGLY